jgi:hypothetical protein
MSRIEYVLREIQQLIEFYDKTKDLREKIYRKEQNRTSDNQNCSSEACDTIKEKKESYT